MKHSIYFPEKFMGNSSIFIIPKRLLKTVQNMDKTFTHFQCLSAIEDPTDSEILLRKKIYMIKNSVTPSRAVLTHGD